MGVRSAAAVLCVAVCLGDMPPCSLVAIDDPKRPAKIEFKPFANHIEYASKDADVVLPRLPPRPRAHMTPRTVDRKKQSAKADVEARTLKVSWPDFAPRPSDDDLKRTFSEFGTVVHCGVGTKKKSGLVVFGKGTDGTSSSRSTAAAPSTRMFFGRVAKVGRGVY